MSKFFHTNGDTLYAMPYKHNSGGSAAPTRVYRSADGGRSWTKLSLQLNGAPVNTPIEVGQSGAFNTLIPLGGNKYNLYRSFDEGNTWTLAKANLPFFRVFETPNGALLGLNSSTNQVLFSANGGQSWSLSLTPSSNFTSSVRLRTLENGYITLENVFGDELYLSENNGQNWSVIPTDTFANAESATLHASSTGALFILGFDVIYRSADNGQTWHKISVIVTPSDAFVELSDGSLLIRVGGYTLFRSTDDGLTWIQNISTTHELSELMPVRLSDGTIFGQCNGLYRSSDGGQTWVFSAQGIDATDVLQMAYLSEDSLFALTETGLWRTFNGGQQWSKLTDNSRRYIDLENGASRRRTLEVGQNGHVVTCEENNLLWSDDLGNTWTDRTPAEGLFRRALALSPGDSFLFVNANTNPQRVLRSTNGGQTWQNTAAVGVYFTQMAFHPSGRIFAIMLNPPLFNLSVWHSDDQGLNWVKTPGLPAEYLDIINLYIDPAGTIWVNGPDAANNYLVSRSTDGGVSWELMSSGPFSTHSGYLSGNTLGHLFQNSALRSLNAGEYWSYLPISRTLDYNTNVIMDPVSPAEYLYVNLRDLNLCRSKRPTTEGVYLNGHVRRDADDDCSTPDASAPLANRLVQASGPDTWWGTTNSLGQYQMFVAPGTYDVGSRTTNPLWWANCDSLQTLNMDTLQGSYTVDFSQAALVNCPLMSVNLGIPLLRRCFDNNIVVQYTNEGTEPADSAWVDVQLDTFLILQSASLPAEPLGNNTYRFQLGNVPSEAGGTFVLTVLVSCNTVLGQTHCVTAHAYPDTLCSPVIGWSGARIEASISCQDTAVTCKLKNIGSATSELLDYIIIIDDVVMMQGDNVYEPGDELVITQPTDGQTWRIESAQEPGYPFATSDHIALAFAEGCGGFNSLGYITQFPVDQFSPSWDTECRENIGAYDPNDKQGFPIGTGSEHRVRPGQALEYLIRFQNTGTDTAFTVVIRDTLSGWLDPGTVRPGASSHPYTWALSGAGVLTFTFENILLPDSNVNLSASQGFVGFQVAQRPDVPLGAVIYNAADIYFDFNEPVRTNTTLHTVGLLPAAGAYTPPVAASNPAEVLLVWPQPATEWATLRRADGRSFRDCRLTLFDALGRPLRVLTPPEGPEIRLERAGLPAGIYFVMVSGVGSGRIYFK